MKPILLPLFACLFVQLTTTLAQVTSETFRSQANQVFQFSRSDEFTGWADHSKTSATAYLWIPEKCAKLKGLLILCSNVPENMLAGHPAIRATCSDNNLGIVWFPKSFYNFKAKSESAQDVAFLQQILNGLAKDSGYDEVATVPWLPMGESGHLLMVDALVEAAPERCIAGIWIKNCHYAPKNRTTPGLVIFGSAQEWGQDKSDYLTRWNDVGSSYNNVLNERKKHPEWPLSLVVDGTSGHFDCSERLTQLIARYVDLISKARLSDDGSPSLRKLDMNNGFLADLPVLGHENHPVLAFSDTSAKDQALPWYPDRSFAEEARMIAQINWNADSQLPAFTDVKGNTFPYSFNGITWIDLNSTPKPLSDGTIPPMLETEVDGITFTIKGKLLDKLPSNFVGGGRPLAEAPGLPTAEWLCGCIEPLGGGKFRVALDRTWPSPIYVAIRKTGTESIRSVVQPAQIGRDGNDQGTSQKIIFDKLSDLRAGTVSIPLSAKADSGLPVRYFVLVGPAIIKDSTLVFTQIPPRCKLPIIVTVSAWQWGRYAEPKIKRADIVTQSIRIIAQ